MASVPAREPGVPLEGADRGHARSWRQRLIGPDRDGAALAQLALAALILLALAALAWHFNVPPRHDAFNAVPDTLRALLGMVVVFGVCGFGLVRLLLPQALRRYEVLWILPTGACSSGIVLTLLGFAAVPYAINLVLVLAAGLALGVYAVRRHGMPPAELPSLAWPVFISFVVLTVALVPMLFAQHYAAPIGTGSDAHVAAGTAEFLKHSYPTGVDPSQPINQMPPLWTSKFPIYYAFAAISSVSGLATWQILAVLAAALLAMAAIGLFLVARELFGAPAWVAVAAMALAGLDRMALYTGLNPYLNQTWGFFAMPFTLVLGWWMVQPGLSRPERQGSVVLFVLFGLVLVFAYPLAAPIPALPIVIFIWSERRRRIRAGERVLRLTDLYRGRRSLIWLIPLCALLAVPVYGVGQKARGALQVLLPGHSLQGWGGDIGHFVPFNYFLSLPNDLLGTVLFVGIVLLVLYGLTTVPRSLAWGLGVLSLIGLVLAVYFRHRQFGYYFHFKLLAFVGPLLMLVAAVGAGRIRRWGPLILAVFVIATAGSIVSEIKDTGRQLPPATIALSAWASDLPHGATVRLDMWPPNQLWAAYFLAARPLCSQLPLLNTDYPHVPYSRKADYIVATLDRGKPADAIGAPLKVNDGYALYRENPAVPGPDNCSQRRQDRLYTGSGWSPR
ncbi:MAG TPA: hypothetical protein VGI87_04700 [Solirubrobacteraceae bacterium]